MSSPLAAETKGSAYYTFALGVAKISQLVIEYKTEVSTGTILIHVT
jgi:hypothetical protein